MTINDIASLLKEHNDFEILTHEYPDGDCLGSAYALCLALQRLDKNARVITTHLPQRFEFLAKGVKAQDFEGGYIVSVDVADEKLLGCNREKYQDKINLCIDHHRLNRVTAPFKYVEDGSAAAGEIIYELIKALGVEITPDIADCLYTAVSTDTGCFCYTNTTSRTMRIAADLLDLGCDSRYINKVMFETKSKKRIELERKIYETISYCCSGKCAVIYTTVQTAREMGDDELEGISSIPRQIEGVKMGITVRQKEGGVNKISVRTDGDIDACKFCRQFGGGGHAAASGCTINGSLEEVVEALKSAAEKIL